MGPVAGAGYLWALISAGSVMVRPGGALGIAAGTPFGLGEQGPFCPSKDLGSLLSPEQTKAHS